MQCWAEGDMHVLVLILYMMYKFDQVHDTLVLILVGNQPRNT